MLKRIIDKRLKLRLCQYSARRIVWKTQIYKCRIRLRQFRNKTIIEGAWHHFDILPSARYIGSGAPRHYICVDIHWIYRVGHCHRIAYIEYISNIASIAFRSVADKNFIRCYINAASPIIVLRNGISEKLISLLRPIAMKCG